MIEMFFNWLLTWGNVIAAILSVIVTLFLVILYRQQKNLLEDSFRASHRAKIEIDNTIITDDGIILDLSNVGNGVAMDLELAILGVYTTEEEKREDGISRNSLRRLDRGELKTAGSLQPGEKEIPYKARIGLPALLGDGAAGFRSGIRKLVEDSYPVTRVYLFLRYRDFTEEHRAEYVRGWEFEPEEEIESIDECLKRGETIWREIPGYDPETNQYDLSEVSTGKEKIII